MVDDIFGGTPQSFLDRPMIRLSHFKQEAQLLLW